MVLVRQRTQLKNRIHATLAKYALHDVEVTDLFGGRGRLVLRQRLDRFPPHTGYATALLLEQIESLDRAVGELERRIQACPFHLTRLNPSVGVFQAALGQGCEEHPAWTHVCSVEECQTQDGGRPR
jgi:hypothetical protein